MKPIFRILLAFLISIPALARAQYGADRPPSGKKDLVPLLGAEVTSAVEREYKGPVLWDLNKKFTESTGKASAGLGAVAASLAASYNESMHPALQYLARAQGHLRVVVAGLQVAVMTHRAFVPELDPEGFYVPAAARAKELAERGRKMVAGYRDNRAQALRLAHSALGRAREASKAAAKAVGAFGDPAQSGAAVQAAAVSAYSEESTLAVSIAEAWGALARTGSVHQKAVDAVERCNKELAKSGKIPLSCHEESVDAVNAATNAVVHEEYRMGENANQFLALKKIVF